MLDRARCLRGDPTGSDAGRDGATRQPDSAPVALCARDSDCDNAAYCDGAERCLPGTAGAGANGCIAGLSPCRTGETCDEAADRCVMVDCAEPDADDDGDESLACGGGDCDDTDPNIRSGLPEACDALGVDEDCNPTTLYNQGPGTNDGDRDGDGFVDARCFNLRADGTENRGTDCDDTAPTINPDGVEACDGRDNDCDGSTDEGVLFTYYLDADGDGAGDDAMAMQGCTPPGPGWILTGGDCSPTDGDVHPGATEVCDGVVDDDCDEMVDDGCACTNGATQPCGPGTGVCAGATQLCVAGAWAACPATPGTEICDGSMLDEDCDGETNEGCTCVSGNTQPCGLGRCAGMQTCTSGAWGSCLRSGGLPAYTPTAETCDGIDSDCDGVSDADDGDVVGVGTSCGTTTGLCSRGTNSCSGSTLVCGGPGYVAPVAETCDHRDNDCDGLRDDGVSRPTCTAVGDATGEFTCRSSMAACPFALNMGEHPTARYLGDTSVPSVDWGRRMTIRADFSVADSRRGGAPAGHLGLLVTPTGALTPRAGADPSTVLPTVAAGQRGLAVFIALGLGYRPEIWELTPTGIIPRAMGGILPTGCLLEDASASGNGPSRQFRVTMATTGGTITATVAGLDGCGSGTVSYTIPDWHSGFYGDSEVAPYPRYHVGAIGWDRQSTDSFVAELRNFTVTRTADSSDGHCVACPW